MNPFMIEQAAMYTAYHRDHRNVWTHVVGVPAIVLAIILALHRVDVGFLYSGLTLGWLFVAFFFCFYIWLHRAAGLALNVLLVIGAWWMARYAGLPAASFWGLFALLFLGGWVFQLFGHTVFEGRKPALADNLLQIFIAPLFLVMEGFFAAGMLKEEKAAILARSHHYDAKTAPA
jgi:uncharacterized membrane protein YGL010W